MEKPINPSNKSKEEQILIYESEIAQLKQEIKYLRQNFGEVLDTSTIENSFFSKMVEESPNPMIRVNRKLECSFLNNAAKNSFFKETNTKGKIRQTLMNLAVEGFSKKMSYSKEVSINDKTYLVDIVLVENETNINMYFIDHTSLKNADDMLWKSEQKYRSIVEVSEDCIIKTDGEGNIIYLNPAASRLLELDKLNSIGDSFVNLVSENQKQLFNIFFFSEEEGHKYDEFSFTTKSGVENWFGIYLIGGTKSYDGTNKLLIARNITQNIKYQERLKRSELRYKKAIGNMKLGLVEMDSNGILQYVHRGFTELTGFSANELVGKHALEVLKIKDEDKEKLKEHAELRRRGKDSTYEVSLLCKDGNWVELLVSGTPLYDEDGSIIGSMGIHMDMTEQKSNEKKILEQAKKVEETAKAKEQFLANMSHEIRTPLNAILGVSRLLKNTSLDIKQKEFLEIVNTSASNLKTIIDDILDLTKINSGKLGLEKSPMKIVDLIKYIKETNRLKSKENNNTLLTFIDEEIQEYLLGDSTRIGQILNNLVSNAVKFTSFGQINLSVVLIEDSFKKQIIQFKVQDNGTGIAPDQIQKIFEPFVQGDDSTTRKYGGTGLGLSISNELLKLHNSKLEVKSEIARGSEFSFILELDKVDAPIEETKEQAEDSDLSHLKILLAEDNSFNQVVVKGVLEPTKAKLFIVDNGQRVLDFLQHTDVDLILMDIQMPIMNGLECSKYIRQNLKNQLPIISLSANVLQSDIEKYIEAGMNDYINKPFEPKDLVNKIIKWTNSKIPKMEKDNLEKKTLPKDKLYSLEKLQNMLSGNEVYIKESLSTLIEHTPEVVATIVKSFEINDLDQVSRMSHRLKATCNILSIDSLSDILISLDGNIKNLSSEVIKMYVMQIKDVMGKVLEDVQKMEK